MNIMKSCFLIEVWGWFW